MGIMIVYFGLFFAAAFPVLIGGGYLLYCLCRKLFPLKHQNKKVLLLKSERQKKWFYNLWLPSIIYSFVYGLFSIFACALFLKMGLFGGVILFLFILGAGSFFWIFYPIYHYFYWLFSDKYYGCKMSWGIFLIFCLVDLISIIVLYVVLSVMILG